MAAANIFPGWCSVGRWRVPDRGHAGWRSHVDHLEELDDFSQVFCLPAGYRPHFVWFFPPELLRSRISVYVIGITRQPGLFFCFGFSFPLQQNTELSVQADKHPEAASKDRVGCLTLADKVTDWNHDHGLSSVGVRRRGQKQASWMSRQTWSPTQPRTLKAVPATLASLEWVSVNVIRRSYQIYQAEKQRSRKKLTSPLC